MNSEMIKGDRLLIQKVACPLLSFNYNFLCRELHRQLRAYLIKRAAKWPPFAVFREYWTNPLNGKSAHLDEQYRTPLAQ